MVDKIKFEEIHKRLTEIIEIYIEVIKKDYGKYMHPKKLEQLNNIKDYGEIIKIYDFGSINGSANDYHVNMPLSAEKVFKKMRLIPGYGINKKHTTYSGEDIILNDNAFSDYVKHVFISGTDTEGYYKDLLLHETMHFCGSGGASALKEGLNEYLTRKVAYKNNFRTNACGYPKEVKVIYELEKIFGEEIINQIAFINNHEIVLNYLENAVSRDAAILYDKISEKTDEEFYEKYYKSIEKYNGIKGIYMKVNNYKKIEYKEVYELLDEYKEKHNLMNSDNKKR